MPERVSGFVQRAVASQVLETRGGFDDGSCAEIRSAALQRVRGRSELAGVALADRRPDRRQTAVTILEEARVAIVPGEAFGTPGYARFSYALGDDDLEEGLTRIAKLLGG